MTRFLPRRAFWAAGIYVIVRGKDLIVSNFDTVTGPDKLNSRHDKPYTISAIVLEK